MNVCTICDTRFDHSFEKIEHLASLAHHIKVMGSGSKLHECPLCRSTYDTLNTYSKHVDSPTHQQALARHRAGPRPPVAPSPSAPLSPLRDAPRTWQWMKASSNQALHRQAKKLRPSTEKANDVDEEKSHKEKKKKSRGKLTLVAEAIMRKKKKKGMRKEVIASLPEEPFAILSPSTPTTSPSASKSPRVVAASVENKSKRYEMAARKSLPVFVKQRNRVMRMERLSKYSLIDAARRGDETVGIWEEMAPPPIPPLAALPPPAPSATKKPRHIKVEDVLLEEEGMDAECTLTSSTSSKYAVCPPVHSTPNPLHTGNWTEFVRGMPPMLDESLVSSSTQIHDFHPQTEASSSYEAPDSAREVKKEAEKEKTESCKMEAMMKTLKDIIDNFREEETKKAREVEAAEARLNQCWQQREALERQAAEWSGPLQQIPLRAAILGEVAVQLGNIAQQMHIVEGRMSEEGRALDQLRRERDMASSRLQVCRGQLERGSIAD